MLKQRPTRIGQDRKRFSVNDPKIKKSTIQEQTQRIVFEIVKKYGEDYRPKQEDLNRMKRERDK